MGWHHLRRCPGLASDAPLLVLAAVLGIAGCHARPTSLVTSPVDPGTDAATIGDDPARHLPPHTRDGGTWIEWGDSQTLWDGQCSGPTITSVDARSISVAKKHGAFDGRLSIL